MAKLSVVISAFNEASRIEKCLQAASFADEIILIDNSSTDTTAKIAKKFTKNVYKRPNNPMLNVNKNFGFSKATGDWILSLDADEVLTSELIAEISEVINKNSNINGYWIPRKNIIFGKWIQNSIWWPDYQLRLFRKGKGKFAEKHVHEMLTIEGETEKLKNPFVHDNYSSISQYLQKLDKLYTESEVEHYIASGKQIAWTDAITFPLQDFLKTFFAQKGYKDGLHGLVLSFLQAFYAEVVFAKIWEKQGFVEYNEKNFLENVFTYFKKGALEMQYWFLTSFMTDTHNIFKKFSLKLARRKIQKKL
ncbi:MAG TPA: glycosyltransferase family 2 protein [Patescibacteria group bacterium]